MANLTVNTLNVTGTAQAGVRVTATLVDTDYRRIVGHTSSGALVSKVDGLSDAAGLVTLALTASSDITPTGSLYAIKIAGAAADVIITKSSATEALLDAIADDPAPLSSTAASVAIAAHVVDDPAHASTTISYSGAAGGPDVDAALDALAGDKADASDLTDLTAVVAAKTIPDLATIATRIQAVEHFHADTPTGWSETLSGGSISDVSTTLGLPGMIRCATGTTSAGFALLSWNQVFFPGASQGTTQWVAKETTAEDGSNTVRTTMGMFVAGLNAGWWLNAAAGEANWKLQVTDGATTAEVDTGVARDTSYHLFTLERTATGVTATIDGTAVTSTTALADALTDVRPVAGVLKATGTTARSLDIGAFTIDHGITYA